MQNKTVVDYEKYLKFSKIGFKRIFPTYMIFLIAFLYIMTPVMIFWVDNLWMGVMAFGIALINTFLIPLTYKLSRKKFVASSGITEQPIVYDYRFFETHFEVDFTSLNGKGQYAHRYDLIYSVTRDEKQLYLWVDKLTAYIVDLDQFDAVTFEVLIDRIRKIKPKALKKFK